MSMELLCSRRHIVSGQAASSMCAGFEHELKPQGHDWLGCYSRDEALFCTLRLTVPPFHCLAARGAGLWRRPWLPAAAAGGRGLPAAGK